MSPCITFKHFISQTINQYHDVLFPNNWCNYKDWKLPHLAFIERRTFLKGIFTHITLDISVCGMRSNAL